MALLKVAEKLQYSFNDTYLSQCFPYAQGRDRHSLRVLEPACYGAAPGICFMEPAPATEDIDFLHIF